MDLIASTGHAVGSAVVFLAGMLVAVQLAGRLGVTRSRSLVLYFWHAAFCIVYVNYAVAYGGDALEYYTASQTPAADASYSLGTAGIVTLTGILSQGLGLSLLGAFLVFNLLGFVGLLALDASLKTATRDQPRFVRRIAWWIVFLPSLSFWSSAIGKDSLAFMAIGLTLWASLELRRRAALVVVGILTMFFVRPHIGSLMALAIVLAIGLRGRMGLPKRVAICTAAMASAFCMVLYALSYSGLGYGIEAKDVADYIEQRQEYNLVGGGEIDIAGMSFPMQLLTYLFRPLPFEASGVPALAASFDNSVLLLVFLIGAWRMLLKKNALEVPGIFLWIYSASAWSLLAMTTANLGISMRQKWMFVPMLVFLLLSIKGRTSAGNRAIRAEGAPPFQSRTVKGVIR